jgi:predicted transposase YdaD
MALSQAYLEWEQATEQRGEQRGRQEGRQEEGLSFVLRLLPHRIGEIPPEIEAQIRTLSLTQLEELGEALLSFSQLSDLQDWLRP